MAREVVGGHVLGPDLAERKRWILADEVAAETFPEESDDAVLLLRFDYGSFMPGASEGDQRIEIHLVEILEAFRPGPGEELLLENPRELRDRVSVTAAAPGVAHIALDGLL